MNIEEAQRVTEELKQATREARECLKDFLAMQKEFREMSDDWADKAGRLMSESAEEAMKNYFEIVQKAIEEATAAVYRRFDTLADIMMGEQKGKGKKGEPLVELLKKKKANEAIRDALVKDELL